MDKTAVVLALLVPALAGISAHADESGAAEEVIVYTNADLERFAPIPSQDAPIAGEDLGWTFVNQVLEQGYARLDANRNYELNHARVEAETRENERLARRRVYGLALAPYGYGRRHDRPHHGRPGPGGDPANRPVPLHARPRVTETGFGTAGRRSGADVSHRRPTSSRPKFHGPQRTTH